MMQIGFIFEHLMRFFNNQILNKKNKNYKIKKIKYYIWQINKQILNELSKPKDELEITEIDLS